MPRYPAIPSALGLSGACSEGAWSMLGLPCALTPLTPYPLKNPAWFSHVARAHRWVAPLTNSRPPMAARCEALPSTHLSGIQ
eukprot:scaffold9156_cov120-Isochrysis_galbana.AAC.9